ncbi:hypothetical protein OROHE_025269 [Orobanche hederae]
MFYSQFILAKKGPLGTIWIAAHLERKLRKNQVADTDVGVSVDSILSPDVPIALRLSSHLLLGVVRIYSRKVTYLFDDCSEALLKVKQAFRSAAVDLPPEEARAPYHLITLPETFDLDDFELPDNDIIQGNFVDHHISSREQITLQDNIDGSGYSTSKFGLDERFGDGDASGLDLDEELLLDKIGSAGHANERSDPQTSVGTVTTLTQDEHLETTTINSGTMVEDDDDGDDPMDYAQAPSTPGLVEEPNLSNVREVSDHLETQCGLVQSTMTESAKNINCGDKQEVSWCSHNNADSDAIHTVLMEENGDTSDGSNVNLAKESGESPAEANSKHFSVGDSSLVSKHTSDLSRNPDLELASKSKDTRHGPNEIFWDKESACGISEGVSAKDQGLLATEVPNSVEIASSGEKSCPTYSDYASKNQDGSLNIDVRVKVTSTEDLFLRPCNSVVEQPDITSGYVVHAVHDVQSNVAALETFGREETVILGKERCIIDSSEGTLKENHIQEHATLEDIHAASGEPNSQVHNANSHDGLVESLNSFTKTELPAPEKLLSVPEGHVDLHQNMLVEVSPKAFVGHGESDALSKIISGKKRSFTGSTLTDQSLNSMESSRLVRCKRTVGSDDDLLSSILAGRSSVLKVKPTPRLSKATSMKRTCSAPRRAPKRKVLMDDTMVLHGDSIRQQLTNTEGIRRVRKKAPCILPEISSIQKQYLEDGFFPEPLFTGMSLELVSLHSQACDLSGIAVVKNDLNGASLEPVPELMLPSENDENVNTLESMFEPMLASHDMKNDHSLATSFEPNVTSPNDEMKEDYEMNEEIDLRGEMTKPTTDMEAVLLQPGVSLDVTGVQTSEENDSTANSTDTSKLEPLYSIEDASLAGLVQPGSITGTVDANTCVNADASAVLHAEKIDIPLVELDSAVKDVDNGQATSNSELSTGKDGDTNDGFETEPEAKGDVLPEMSEDGTTGELHGDKLAKQFIMVHSSVNNGENPEPPEVYQQSTMDAEIRGFDPHDQEEFKYSAARNDTEFLNVDDDELNEIAEDHIPDDDDYEEAQFTEYTGWSSRTRAVSRYLQTLFVKEVEFGRESLSMDNLLIGKSRKEASRMFFEALVLKTRDYIQVEQSNPYDDITIKPRTRLMKYDF